MTALRAGRAAAEAGIGRETLRYYERRGLVDAPERTLGGHRVYTPEAVARLRLIKSAQRLGFTLDEIAALTAPQRDGGLQAGARAKLAQVEERIAELRHTADLLRRALAAGCDDLGSCRESPDCPLPA